MPDTPGSDGGEPVLDTQPSLGLDIPGAAVAEFQSPGPAVVAPQPQVVPGHDQQLKRWTFVAVLATVWLPAAAAGLGLYYWWFQSLDKRWPLFVVLVLIVGCVVIGLLLSMVEDRPIVAAMALAIMAAPFAVTVAAAVLHGAYYFQWIERPG